jgi:putative aminopeptidase FrvX
LRKDAKDEKAPQVHELYVDVGAGSAIDVRELGLRVGHPAVYADQAEEFGHHRIVGRAIDNRIGGFILARVLAQLSRARDSSKATVLVVNAVQEEIGGHGAKMIAHRLMPDLCIVVDVTHATDTPGIEHEKHGEVKLGAGPSVTHGSSSHPRVVQRVVEVAEKLALPLQHESSSRHTGTDTDTIFDVREGIPSALISLPLRYMHSVVETADLRDVDHLIALVAGFVTSIVETDEFAFRL